MTPWNVLRQKAELCEQMAPPELRTVMSLARLWRYQGKRRE